MTDAVCKDCGAALKERRKSLRKNELLLICLNGHKWQARIRDGYLHLYRSNWKGQRGEGRRVKTITVSRPEQELMDSHGVSQQAVYKMGIDLLRSMQ